MNLFKNLKETAVSVLPVMVIVIILGLTAAPLGGVMLGRFALGGVLLILGLSVFLFGVELGIQPMGERAGAALTQKKNLPLLLFCAFIIGFMVTIAEPDIQVFGNQVCSIFPSVNKNIFTLVIALGVGVFMLLGLLRTVMNFSIKIILAVLYVILFVLVFLIPENFIGIAFDSGGATTGPLTVPFILALGLGVSSVRQRDNQSFGLTGVTSIGPVLAVLCYSFAVYKNMSSGADTVVAELASDSAAAVQTESFFSSFISTLPHVLKDSAFSMVPLLVMFAVFQFTLLKMSLRQVIRMLIGFLYSFAGLVIILTGVNGGFMQAGRQLGFILGQKAGEAGGWWFVLLIATGFVLGAIVVCAEPAVWVLTAQVEEVSGGTIKRKVLLGFLSAGSACAIGLALWRAVDGFSIKYLLVPGYALALILMIFSPDLFTGIAFDSGGVASGPITSTFILSFAVGASEMKAGAQDVFGVIAMVAMTPLIAIQILGIMYRIKTRKKGGEQK